MFTPRKTLTILSVALAAGLLCAANKPPKPAPSAYTLTMLKVPAGCTVSSASAVNEFGQVVGYVLTATRNNAAVWDTASSLPTLLDDGFGSNAIAINNHGQVVGGCVLDLDHGLNVNPVVWVTDGQGGYEMIDLIGDPEFHGWANGINDAGDIVGEGGFLGADAMAFVVVPEDADGDEVPDTWFRDTDENGVNDLMFFLGPDLNSYDIEPYAINDLGWVVGKAAIRFDVQPPLMGGDRAFLIIPDYTLPNPWFCDRNGDGANDLMRYFPSASEAADVTDAGQIVGGAGNLFTVAADGTVAQTVLPTPTTRYRWSYARAINESGQVVGWGHSNGNSAQEPFLWQKDMETVLLQSKVSNLAGFSALTTAIDINNSGLIIGTGTTRAGNRAYLATPPAGN